MDFPFAHRQRVRFGETDLQGVVYYGNYLLFAEVGRVAYLRELGVLYERDLLARGVDFTIGEARVRYHAPLRRPCGVWLPSSSSRDPCELKSKASSCR